MRTQTEELALEGQAGSYQVCGWHIPEEAKLRDTPRQLPVIGAVLLLDVCPTSPPALVPLQMPRCANKGNVHTVGKGQGAWKED